MGLFSKGPVLKVRVGGMTCDHCVGRVKTALENLPGVKKADVDLKKREAQVFLESEGAVSVEDVISAVSMAGFDASPF